ncbi:unnamed protein product [Cladocopium goreaui]|uniref:PPM-type phosphatase domain-containing protein n=1 Tax=Cladocopium goreaui TaxID=2562237 RepID=A0A9P1CH83_9DINO|nr:unnamed protein product [Cladocopium goreaui]
MFGCCTCERATRAEAVAKVAPAPSASAAAAPASASGRGKRRSVKAAKDTPKTDVKDEPAAAVLSAADHVQADANLKTSVPEADGQEPEAAEVPEAPDASEMPKRTHRRSHFIPSSAAAAAGEASPLSAELDAGKQASPVADPTGSFEGTHKVLLGVTKTVHGSTPLVESEFKEKFVEQSGCDSESAARSRFLKAGVAISCAKGMKPGTPNQDNFFVTDCGNFLLCCVADGHGSAGHWVSHWTCKFVLRMMLEQMEKAKSLPTTKAMMEIFEKVHKEVIRTANSEKFEVGLSGTTLSVAVIDREKRKILLAWAGDSRCVLGRPVKKGEAGWEDQPITNQTIRRSSATEIEEEPTDATANTEDTEARPAELCQERRRVEEQGGEVLLLPGDVPHRVFAKGKEIPGLAMSRSIGDLAGHKAGIIHQPGIEWLDFQKDDLLLCCSDGVWEFLSNVEALNIVSQVGKKNAADGVQKLSAESRRLWLAEADDCCDDITVIAVWLS